MKTLKIDDMGIPTSADLLAAARILEEHYERSICHHTNLTRAGMIWTVCNDCGAKWADDQGGFRSFEYPAAVVKAKAVLTAASEKGAPPESVKPSEKQSQLDLRQQMAFEIFKTRVEGGKYGRSNMLGLIAEASFEAVDAFLGKARRK